MELGSALERTAVELVFIGQNILNIITSCQVGMPALGHGLQTCYYGQNGAFSLPGTVPTFKDGCLHLASKSTQEVRLKVGNFLRCCDLSLGAPRAQYQLQRRGLRMGRGGES